MADPSQFYLNKVDDPQPITPRRVYTEHILSCSQYDAAQLVELMLLISARKITGSLTINYCQGTIAGTIEWKEKVST